MNEKVAAGLPALIRALRCSSDSLQSYVIKISEGSADSAALSAVEGLPLRADSVIGSAILDTEAFKIFDYVIDRIRYKRDCTMRGNLVDEFLLIF